MTAASGRAKAAIVWFRNDLRLADNPSLAAALQQAEAVLPVFILGEEIGGAARWWLHHSLAALAADLHRRGASLVLRRGDPATVIAELAAKTGAGGVHVGLGFEPAARAAEDRVEAALKKSGVMLTRHIAATLFHPEAIKTRSGGPFNVFTPFSHACFEHGVSDEVIPAPVKIPGVTKIAGDRLDDWKLLPTRPDWAGGLRDGWRPGEAGAAQRLATFLDGPIATYDKGRDLPGEPGTSMLSPHSHYGEISPRTLWHAAAKTGHGRGAQTFLKELLWREFTISLLWQHPDLPDRPIRPEFETFPWRKDPPALAAWQRGRTGVPIVDAGMRQLWQTGWMHNRMRMIVASYLTKHLLISWVEGAAWFMDTLCEADLAANSANWQWVAGCGADAAPYFRIFNPVLQGRKFDADGAYVRQYVPELAALPDKFIHAPWEADAATLTNARVTLGETYPHPIISLSEGRERALAAYQKIRA